MAEQKITKRYVCDEDVDKCDTEFTVTTSRENHEDMSCPVCGGWATARSSRKPQAAGRREARGRR